MKHYTHVQLKLKSQAIICQKTLQKFLLINTKWVKNIHTMVYMSPLTNISRTSQSSCTVLYTHQGWGQVQLTKYSSTPSTPNILPSPSTGQVLRF